MNDIEKVVGGRKIMKRWKIPDVGEIHFEFEKDMGRYYLYAEDFLKKFIDGITKRASNYHINTRGFDHLFIYTEEQLNTAVCPTIACDISSIFKMEFPIRRYGKTRRGNLDYWIYYKDVVFALEMKLAHVSYDSHDYTEKSSIFEKFNKAIVQLEGVEKDGNLYFMPNTKGVIKIALVAIVFKKNSIKEITIDENLHHEIEKKFNAMISTGKNEFKGYKFKKDVNFKSIWFLENDLIPLKQKRRNKFRLCPAMGFIGHISDFYTLP